MCVSDKFSGDVEASGRGDPHVRTTGFKQWWWKMSWGQVCLTQKAAAEALSESSGAPGESAWVLS